MWGGSGPGNNVDWATLAQQWIQMREAMGTTTEPSPLPLMEPTDMDTEDLEPTPIDTLQGILSRDGDMDYRIPGEWNKNINNNSYWNSDSPPSNEAGLLGGSGPPAWNSAGSSRWGSPNPPSGPPAAVINNKPHEPADFGPLHGNEGFNSYEFNHISDQYDYKQTFGPGNGTNNFSGYWNSPSSGNRMGGRSLSPLLATLTVEEERVLDAPPPMGRTPLVAPPALPVAPISLMQAAPVLPPRVQATPSVITPPSLPVRRPGFDRTLSQPEQITPPVIDAAKRKTLPAWIREGLEKMEREKQKKLDRERSYKERNTSLADESSIDTVGNGGLAPAKSRFDSPLPDPPIEEILAPNAVASPVLVVPNEIPSVPDTIVPIFAEPEPPKTEEEIQAELMVRVRKMLTEILLEVTNNEIYNVARKAVTKAQSKVSVVRVAKASTLSALKSVSGTVGLGGLSIYASDSESDPEDSNQRKTDESSEDSDSDDRLQARIRQRQAEFSRKEVEIIRELEREEKGAQGEVSEGDTNDGKAKGKDSEMDGSDSNEHNKKGTREITPERPQKVKVKVEHVKHTVKTVRKEPPVIKPETKPENSVKEPQAKPARRRRSCSSESGSSSSSSGDRRRSKRGNSQDRRRDTSHRRESDPKRYDKKREEKRKEEKQKRSKSRSLSRDRHRSPRKRVGSPSPDEKKHKRDERKSNEKKRSDSGNRDREQQRKPAESRKKRRHSSSSSSNSSRKRSRSTEEKKKPSSKEGKEKKTAGRESKRASRERTRKESEGRRKSGEEAKKGGKTRKEEAKARDDHLPKQYRDDEKLKERDRNHEKRRDCKESTEKKNNGRKKSSTKLSVSSSSRSVSPASRKSRLTKKSHSSSRSYSTESSSSSSSSSRETYSPPRKRERVRTSSGRSTRDSHKKRK